MMEIVNAALSLAMTAVTYRRSIYRRSIYRRFIYRPSPSN